MKDLYQIALELWSDPKWGRIIRRPEYAQFKQDITNLTNFLPTSAKFAERLYIIIHKLKSRPKCVQCEIGECNWDGDKKQYRTFCCNVCAQSNDATKNKRAQTNLNRFGEDNPLKVDSIRATAIATLQERYGVSHPMESADIRAKVVVTNLNRYGVEYSCTNDVVSNKRKTTNIDRYGTDYPFQSDVIQHKVISTVLDKYGVTSTALLPDVKQQQEISKLSTYHQKFPFYDKIRDKTFIYSEYVENNRTQTDIAKIVGCAQETISKIMNFHNIPIIPRSFSTIENEIFDFISTVYTGTIIKCTRKLIPPLELDIVLPDINLAIEVNGIYWHSELAGKLKNYHIDKTNACRSIGYQLIHITDADWLTKRAIVESRIRMKLNCQQRRIYARNLQVVEVTKRDSDEFMNLNHIQGTCNSTIRYGLIDKTGCLIGVMTFGDCRFSTKYDYELLRFASVLNTSIVGGASKLLTHFIRNHIFKTIVSYCDTSWNTGEVYKKLGFEFSHNSAPNYKYFISTDTTKLFNRVKFQKHKLPNLLSTFDCNLTEWENMKNNGYNRIWDCGSSVWVFNKSIVALGGSGT